MKSEKKCGECNVFKPTSDFYIDKSKASRSSIGYRYCCKMCEQKKRILRKSMIKESKFNAIHNGLPAIVKKVYQAVPIKDIWDKRKIIQEVHRIHPSLRDQSAILGCLDTLKRSGLINEPETGSFRREKIENSAAINNDANQQSDKANMTTTDQQSKPELSPIERIIDLQTRTSKMKDSLRQTMQDLGELTDEIETVAIEIEVKFSERDAESQKLKQLQTLLKGLV